MSFTPSSRFFTLRMKASTSPPSFLIFVSISSTAWLAPPCSGPQRALMPAEIDANRLACEEPTSRTVEVEQFCSWSACRISSFSSALTTTGFSSNSSAGTAKVIRRKFST